MTNLLTKAHVPYASIAAMLSAILLATPATAADAITLELIGAVRMQQPGEQRQISADEQTYRAQAHADQHYQAEPSTH